MIRLEPTNLALIDEDQKGNVVGRFNGIFNNENLQLLIVKELVVNGNIKFNTYNVYSNAEDFIPTDFMKRSPRLPKVIREYARYVIIGEGSDSDLPEQSLKEKLLGVPLKTELPKGMVYATSLCIFDLPETLTVGLAFHPDLDFEIASLNVKRIDPNDTVLQRYERIAELSSELSKNSTKLENIRIMREGLQRKNTFLHRWDVIFTFTAKTINTLESRVEQFKKDMSRLRIKVDRPSYIQKQLFETRNTRMDYSLLSNTTTLSAFYPFSSMELIEDGRNGIYLGKNLHTLSPVIYNRDNRQFNYHIVICGTTGVGKSMTTKVMLNRMCKILKEFSMVIIDPSPTREYRNLASTIGIEYKSLEEGIGIDPLYYSPSIATDILSKLFKLDDKQSDQLLRIIEKMEEKNVFKLESVIPEGELLERIHHGLVKYGFIFKGTFPTGSFAVSTFSYDDDAIKAASTMIMLRTKELFNKMDLNVPKILVVDEGWKLIEDKHASDTLSTISREGRKSNISLVFITQDPKDILENITGRTILNNCDTKILMQTDASMELSEALSLSSIEENLLKTTVEKTDLGTALVIASHKHIHCKIEVSEEEMKLFTTKS